MTLSTAATAPRHAKSGRHWLPQSLLACYLMVWVVLAVSPVDRHDWLLENLLAISTVAVLILTYRRFAFSDLSYVLITLFMILHAVGAHYTYAKVPFGFWMKDVFDLSRNHFDRIVHFAFGLLLAYPAYDLFLRAANMRKAWALLMAAISVISVSGLFEVIESWVAQLVSPELGNAYLGTQGDIWDAQKDMTMAIVGALLTVGLTHAISKNAAGPARYAHSHET
jgi:putative membrane protein